MPMIFKKKKNYLNGINRMTGSLVNNDSAFLPFMTLDISESTSRFNIP